MNESLTERFLSNPYNKESFKQINTSTLTENNIVSVLDNLFNGDWTFKINNVVPLSNGLHTLITLFIPGKVIDGSGTNEWEAVCNIIKHLIPTQDTVIPTQDTTSIQIRPVQQQTVQENTIQNESEQPKKKTADIMAELSNVQSKIKGQASDAVTTTTTTVTQENNSSDSFFDDLIDSFDSNTSQESAQETQVEEPSNTTTQEVVKVEMPKNPTPEEVNPTNQIMSNNWTTEQGDKIKKWIAENGINGKEQMSAWLIRYCGLDYDHFNPEWTDKFLEWAEALRERQTY